MRRACALPAAWSSAPGHDGYARSPVLSLERRPTALYNCRELQEY
ncbi:MAG: hypothetical protein ABR998_01235 [Gemmatimonadales bacterium]